MAIQKWHKLSTKKVFSHPRMTLYEDQVKLPDGKVMDYLLTRPANDSVAIIAQNDNGDILVSREYSYPPDQVMWQLPGGAIEGEESVEAAAARELLEECGYKADKSEIIGYYYVSNRRSTQKQYVVLCTGLTEVAKSEDPEEFIENYWKTPEELDAMVDTGEIVNINFLAGLKLWDRHKAKQKA